jgi:TP901 family phage tail tape measure protein
MFDMKQATDILTDAQSALGLSVEDPTQNMENMVRVSDALVKANTLANASVQQFGEALTNKAGAQLRAMNVDLEEGVAALAAFADQGLKGATAGERLNIVLRDLPKAVRENQEAFQALGIEVFDSEGNLRSLSDIVASFEGALGGLPAEQQKARLAQLGLNEQVADGLTQLLGTSEAMRRYRKELERAGGTTDEVAKKQQQGLSVAFGDVRGSVNNLMIALGEMQSGPLVSLLDTTANAIDDIREWSKENEGLAATLVQGTAATGAFVGITGTATAALGFMTQGIGHAIENVPKLWSGLQRLGSGMVWLTKSTWKGVTAMGSWIASQWSSLTASIANAGGIRAVAAASAGKLVRGMKAAAAATKAFTVSLLTNPATWIAAGIAGAAFLIWKHWKPIKSFFEGFWEDVKPWVQPALDWFASWGPTFKAMWAEVKPILSGIWDFLEPIGSVLGLGGESSIQLNREQRVQIGGEPVEVQQGMPTAPGAMGLNVTPDRFQELIGGGSESAAAVTADALPEGLGGGGEFGGGGASSQLLEQAQAGAPSMPSEIQELTVRSMRVRSAETAGGREQPVQVTVTANPKVTIQGNASREEVRAGIEQGMDMSDFKYMLRQAVEEIRRDAF